MRHLVALSVIYSVREVDLMAQKVGLGRSERDDRCCVRVEEEDFHGVGWVRHHLGRVRLDCEYDVHFLVLYGPGNSDDIASGRAEAGVCTSVGSR